MAKPAPTEADADATIAALTAAQAAASTPANALTPEQVKAQTAKPAPTEADADAAIAALSTPYGGFTPTDVSRSTEDTAVVPEPPGMAADLWETVRPTRGRNEAYEGQPDLFDAPEFKETGINSGLAFLGTLAAGPEDAMAILKKQFPDTKVEKDGRYILLHSKDGNTYSWKPGIRFSDLARIVEGGLLGTGASTAGAAALATVPALRNRLPSGAVPAAIGAGVTGAAALEGLKSAAGGAFNWWQLPIAALLSGGGALLQRGAAPGGIGPAAPSPAQQAMGAVQQGGTALAAPLPLSSADPAAAALVKAGVAGPGDAGAMADAAFHLGRNQPLVNALEEVQPGLSDKVPPTLLADPNGRGAAIAQRVGSAGSSPLRSAENAAQREIAQAGQDLIGAHGGDVDPSVANDLVRRNFMDEHAQLSAAEKANYQFVDARAGKLAANPKNTRNLLESWATGKGRGTKGLGGFDKLPAELKAVYTELQENPTYEKLDLMRKQVGSKLPNGPFASLEGGMREKLYGALAADQEATVRRLDYKTIKAYADAQAATRARKALEDSAETLFGRGIEDTSAGLKIDGDMMPKASAAMKALANGDPYNFKELMSHVPPALQKPVAVSAVADLLGASADKPAEFTKFFKNWSGLTSNAEGADLLRKTIGGEAFDKLSAFAKVSEDMHKLGLLRSTTGNVAGDMARLAAEQKDLTSKLVEAAVLPKVGRVVGGTVGGGLGLLGGGAAGGHAGALGGLALGVKEGASAGHGLGTVIQNMLTKAPTDSMKAVETLLLSPEFATAAKAQALSAAGKLPGPGLMPRAIAGLVNSRPFNFIMQNAGIPPTQRAAWVKQVLNAGVQVGTQPEGEQKVGEEP